MNDIKNSADDKLLAKELISAAKQNREFKEEAKGITEHFLKAQGVINQKIRTEINSEGKPAKQTDEAYNLVTEGVLACLGFFRDTANIKTLRKIKEQLKLKGY